MLLAVAGVCVWGGYKTVFTPMQSRISSLEAEKETAKGLPEKDFPFLNVSNLRCVFQRKY